MPEKRAVIVYEHGTKQPRTVSFHGMFHEWGKELEEDSSGFHEASVGLIEDATGQMHAILPYRIQFTGE